MRTDCGQFRRENKLANEMAAAVLVAAPDDATLANQKNVAALSQVRPDARTDKQVDSLVVATRQLDAFANLSPLEHHGLARVWTYDQLGGGESLCRINEEQPAYFIVASGAMEVETQRLSHNLGENDVTPSGVSSSNRVTFT
jgi:secreted protein with Ig-like and vWFA domain